MTAPSPYLYQRLDPDWLRQKFVNERWTMAQIAEHTGLAIWNVAYACERYEIRRPNRWRAAYLDPEWLRRKYIDQQLTCHEIAALTDVCATTVRNRLRSYGIPLRPRGYNSRRRSQRPWHDPDWLHQKYIIDGWTQRQLAQHCGVHPQTIAKALRRHGLHRRRSRACPTTGQPRPRQLYIFFAAGQPVFMRLAESQPQCPTAFDTVRVIPVRDRPPEPQPPQPQPQPQPTESPVAAWLADLVP